MESIKPEKDELDAREARDTRSRRKAEVPPKKRPILPKASRPGDHKAEASGVGRSSKGLILLLFILVVSVAVFGYWQVRQQAATIQAMDQQLAQSRRMIDQSQLVIARLEGQVYQTDATMAQSGNELARELQKMDESLRKLDKSVKQRLAGLDQAVKKDSEQDQGVQKRVDGLRGELAGIEPMLNAMESRLNNLDVRIQKQFDDLKVSLNEDTGRISGLEKQLATLAPGQASNQAAVEALEAQSSRLAADLKKLQQQAQSGTSISPAEWQDVRQTVKAVDTARGQLVQRFVNLDRKLNEISLELQALRAEQAGASLAQ